MLKRKLLTSAILAITFPVLAKSPVNISLQQIGSYHSGVFAAGAAEIVAFDPETDQLFVINANANTVDVLDISDPTGPLKVNSIDVLADLPLAGGVNSVAVHHGLVAIAVEHADRQANGWAAFYTTTGDFLAAFPAGALPDMITFTPNGDYVLVANEGEPSSDYQFDPEGSVTVIDIKKGLAKATIRTAHFQDYNINGAPEGVRISGPGASVAQDLEPEYITIADDSRTAWVTLQENNALAIIDIRKGEVKDLVALGSKDHSIEGQGLDASNSDGHINIQTWPVLGTFMPDAIASYKHRGTTYLVTANEGDGREYIYGAESEEACESAGHEWDDGDCIAWLDEARIRDLDLDPAIFPGAAALQANAAIGRLKVLATEGWDDGDADYESLHAYGARSISIWNEEGQQVADTGDVIEVATALVLPDYFNSSNDDNDSFDDRSDDKGPEPEGVVIGKVQGRQFAFVGLERIGGVMVFDVTDPAAPHFVSYTNNRDFLLDAEDPAAGDLGPEGLVFIDAHDSPNHKPLLVVGNEISGTTTIYQVVKD
ncbi:MAG TPA: choice-of-anchor I family protein [Xanthomonadales bacterium]|nr:choice-of-anchor I family protein [Xanthomonadales bacterium]